MLTTPSANCGVMQTRAKRQKAKRKMAFLNGIFIPFRNVYWGYWVTAATFSSAGKFSILLKYGGYL